MIKKVFVLIDGLGDLPCPELDGKTPLEAAKTPNLDYYALNGSCGVVYPVGPKVAPESDQGVMGMLGYDPYKYYTGRGPLEAVGAKVRMKNGDLALRANFASIVGKKLVDRRVGRTLTSEEAKLLSDSINKGLRLDYNFEFRNTLDHRGVLVIHGDFSSEISNVDPAYVREGKFNVASKEKNLILKKCRPLDGKEKSSKSADVVNEFVKKSYKILNDHPVNRKRGKRLLLPANIVLLRDAGVSVPSFPKKSGWAVICAMPLEKGIGKLCGMRPLIFSYPKLKVGKERFSCLMEQLKVEIKAAKKYIRYGDFDNYYIHFKPTDVAGHDGDALMKARLIEEIDKRFFKFLRRKECELVVSADHSTPCSLKRHSSDPVPLLWYGGPKDEVKVFSEKECSKGSLGKLLGKEVFKKVGFG